MVSKKDQIDQNSMKWGPNWMQNENENQIEQRQRKYEPNVYLSQLFNFFTLYSIYYIDGN